MNAPQTPKPKKNNSHPKELLTQIRPDASPAAPSVVAACEPILARSIPKLVLMDQVTFSNLLLKPSLLSSNVLAILNEERVECLVSAFSIMQWAEYVRSGTWQLSVPFDTFVQRVLDYFQLTLLQVEASAWRCYAEQLLLPNPKKKLTELSFDERWLMAQATATKATLLTPNAGLHQYANKQFKCIW